MTEVSKFAAGAIIVNIIALAIGIVGFRRRHRLERKQLLAYNITALCMSVIAVFYEEHHWWQSITCGQFPTSDEPLYIHLFELHSTVLIVLLIITGITTAAYIKRANASKGN